MRVTVLEETTAIIGTYDVDGNVVTVTANFDLPSGAQFDEDPDNPGTYKFTWTPENMDNVTLE